MTDTCNVQNTDWMFEPSATDKDKARILWMDKKLHSALSRTHAATSHSYACGGDNDRAREYKALSETAGHVAQTRGMQALRHFARSLVAQAL